MAVIGAGAVGTHRAAAAVRHPRSELVWVVDPDEGAAQRLADQHGVPFAREWSPLFLEATIDVAVVCTPHVSLAEASIAALKAGRHVLVEAPMGRNVSEAVAMSEAATAVGCVLKIGLHHRYYPGLTRAHAYYSEGVIGEIIHIRARYGHGVRPASVGHGAEWWREDRELVAGGQLTDHGLHVVDLVHWFAGEPKEAIAFLQTAAWPIKPLEDSAFAMLRFERGAVAILHTSWTEWAEHFEFEVTGTQGSLRVEGLGTRYGQHRLTVARRRTLGDRPYTETTVFDDDDLSWDAEWAEFVAAVEDGLPFHGSPYEGVTVMNILDGLYRSAEANAVVPL